MSKLTSGERDALPSSAFAVPTKRAYPIQNASHARAALSRVSEHGNAALRKRVRDLVSNRYPGIKEGKPK
jgi:hypothetical protein